VRDLATLGRGGLVGVAATAADLAALAFLVEVAGLDPRIANIPALAAGILAQFAGSKLFTFRDRSPACYASRVDRAATPPRHGEWLRQGALFSAVEAGALILNALLFHLLVTWGAGYGTARIAGSALVYFGFSLPLWSRIFRSEARS
jgi:hypothetical protein